METIHSECLLHASSVERCIKRIIIIDTMVLGVRIMHLKKIAIITILTLTLLLNGCTIISSKCSPWMPYFGWKGLMNGDIDTAIKESAGGTKCEVRFE